MEIKLKELTVRELTEGYQDNNDDGVTGYGGQLNIRPPYQREFIYKGEQRDAVIRTLRKDFPLNVMYWVVRDDGTYEVLDGQQRTISICQYVHGVFSLDGRYFHNLQTDEQEQILSYKLMIYLCKGEDSEKLEWFKTINIAGEKLTDQELRNAVYAGPWVTDAKKHFSKTGGPAYNKGGDYLNGAAIRQEYLETVIKWKSQGAIAEYMATRQHAPHANELWLYFCAVIDWAGLTFPNYRREMKGQDWGGLYDQFHQKTLDAQALERDIARLMADDDVTNKRGIYPYVLTREERHLNIRAFTANQKREAYERQQGQCPRCKGKHYELADMEADHITPWHEGGKTTPDNCQMLCKAHNRRKGGE
jgi:hypothetical protein